MTEPIAVVGVDCRFPGAPDTAAYWDLLMRSGDGVGPVPPLRWRAADFHAPEGGAGRANTAEGGFIDDPDAFDHEFFTVSPREAAAMDPQQRLLLQSAWRSVEDAGISPGRLAGSDTGVFVGIMGNEWAQLHLTDYENVTAQLGSGNGYCMAANRISYHLDLKGPSLAVDTACSSSLVAAHLAVNSLLAGECSTAVVGGVNVALTPALAIFYTQAGLSAPDGRCKPFSGLANGIGRGEGVGTVVLRRLSDAVADGQRVYAVIRGTAVNQDGRSNGLTAPNRWAQQDVLAAAYRRAGVEPADIAFTEGHGTGTALGDMMEVKALGHHHAGRAKPMALGSVKGNLGHTEGAAGIAGLIKVVLALHHGTVPASRYATKENRGLKLRERGLRLLKAPMKLPAGTTVAGLSSFGMGGTNAHAVLQSAPPAAARPRADDTVAAGAGAALFTLTAPTAEALRRNLSAQADAVAARRAPVGGLGWSAARAKQGHRHRFAVTAADTGALAGALREAAERPDVFARLAAAPSGSPRTAFLFTGQGSQYPYMTRELYGDSALYRHHLDAADAALAPHTGRSIRDLVLGGDEALHRTACTQPALFAVGYALAATLSDLGVRPHFLLGHSVGEYAAAVLAGVFPLEAGARLIAARGALMQELPAGGGMVAVRAAEHEVAELVAAEPLVSVAAVNGPRAVVLSGDLAALGRIGDALGADGVKTTPLTVSHAFHSPLMEPVTERFAAVADEVGGGVPEVPVYSTVYGRQLAGEAMDAGYWVRHVGATVRFADAAAELLGEGPTHLVEIGPKAVLTSLAKRLPAAQDTPRPTTVLPVRGAESGGADLAEAVAALYRAGLDPEWEAFYAAADRGPQPLAPYAFSTEHRFWALNPVTAPDTTAPPAQGTESGPAGAAPEEERDGSVTVLAPTWGAPGPVAGAVLGAVGQVGGYPPAQLTPHLRLYEDLGFDSVMVMELKNRLEERLPAVAEMTVQDLLPRLSSIGELVTFLGEHAATDTREEKSA